MTNSTATGAVSDREAFEAGCRQGIVDWVASTLGGEVREITRLERYRPQWKVSYTAGETGSTVLFRGNRPIAGDAGQFMSAGSEVLALLDFEIANIGDTRWDLACFRGRQPYENMGDIPALYQGYAEVTGDPVDLPVVCYHTVNFQQLSGIGARFFMEPCARGANWIEGVLEYASITRHAHEAVAELQGIELDYTCPGR